ncbi:MAG: efflux RND transporter permease subunit [Gemmatimonadetes bacterium]|jgi:heavy metal efflux system protein|nr:efflux RND transporter permease subunit [Gemmatimonadota bacterium]MBT7863003.1 efflux RND transporter permease subunit [Gemmatimonadota bacterium]
MEQITQLALRSRMLMAVLGLLVLGGGYLSYLRLPVDAFPDVTPTLVQVFTETEGLAPEEVERFVTYPVEVALNGLPDLKQVRSISNFGLSVVNVYFEDDTDIYFARQLVNERLQLAREQIPEGFGDPQMGPIATGLGQVLFYFVEDETGELSPEQIRQIQDWLIKFNLQIVPGVTEILSLGGQVKQFQVMVDPDALLRYDLSLQDVVHSVRANNANVGAQFIVKGAEQYVVRSVGLTERLEDLERIVVKAVAGHPIYLNQVAQVQIGGEVRQGLATMNGEGETVVGMVLKLIGTNTSLVIEDVQEQLASINEVLPPGVRVVPYYDQASLVAACLDTVTTALVQGVFLVAIVLLLFMGGLRPSLVVAASIPFSILFAFILMKVFGISANLMSLGGLAIAIGMMVDGTIVIVENVDRRLRTSAPNESRLHVVSTACAEVARPIGFAIGIIILVFLPLFTLQGVEGKTFRPLAYTVSLAMLGSLLFALLLAPVASYWVMRRGHHYQQQEGRLVGWLLALYRPLLTWFIRHRIGALGLAGILLMIGIGLFPFLGSEFVPRLNEGDLLVRITMAPSISLDEASRVTSVFERRLKEQFPEVTRIVSRVGRGEVGAHADPVNNAESFVALRPQTEWTTAHTPEELYAAMGEAFEDFPGAQFNFTQPIAAAVDELLTGTKAELAIKLFGPEMDVLAEKAADIEAIIHDVPGASDVQRDQVTGTPQLRIAIDRDAIARHGINVADVQSVIRTAIGGQKAGQVFEGVARFDIIVRYREDARNRPERIGRILVPAPSGALIPLRELTKIEQIVGPRQITRESNGRFITIQCNVRGRDMGSFVAEARAALDADLDLPPGYIVRWGGQFQLQQEANERLALVVPVTLLVIFLLLFTTFNSLKSALLILLNIPLGLVGGVVALWITGQSISVPASVGFIALFGIALENGLVLVTYLNQLRLAGTDLDEASIEGACRRLRPVLMTALTTALGLLPLLYSSGTGSEVQRPLATVVLGGLVTSTVLTLVVLPALYRWFAIDVPSEGGVGIPA